MNQLEKYLSHTIQNGDCLEWQRCFNTDGYPRARNKETSNLKVHREVFFLVNGFYPPVVRHTCDNIKCINPKHLIGGTHLDNENDKKERGRIPNQCSPELIEKILFLRDEGFKYKQIAETLGIKRKKVDYVLYKYKVEKG